MSDKKIFTVDLSAEDAAFVENAAAIYGSPELAIAQAVSTTRERVQFEKQESVESIADEILRLARNRIRKVNFAATMEEMLAWARGEKGL